MFPIGMILPSYEVHRELKNQIEDVLHQIRMEARDKPSTSHQIRNRTLYSITKRYLYLRDAEKLRKCLSDARRLLEKYRSSPSSN